MSAPLTHEELRDLASIVKKGVSGWRWIHTPAGGMKSPALWVENGVVVRTEADGDHTPEEIVRTIYDALKRERERRRESAAKAAVTRAKRRQLKIDLVVQRYRETGVLTPSKKCQICGRALDDHESIQRGIGSECWQGVLSIITAAKAREAEVRR
jgi:hypothetical protein